MATFMVKADMPINEVIRERGEMLPFNLISFPSPRSKEQAKDLRVWGKCFFILEFSFIKIRLSYFVEGNLEGLKLSSPSLVQTPSQELKSGRRSDGLWQTTCFEFFIRLLNSKSYFEFNFSPCGDWNCYSFQDYRHDMKEVESETFIQLPSSGYFLQQSIGQMEFNVEFAVHLNSPLGQLFKMGGWKANLTSILDWEESEKSYWALQHPPDKPDFHADQCFILYGPCVPLPFLSK